MIRIRKKGITTSLKEPSQCAFVELKLLVSSVKLDVQYLV